MTPLDKTALEAAAKTLPRVWPGGFEDQRQKDDGTGWANPPWTPNDFAREVAANAITAYIDALSSLPAQAVGVKMDAGNVRDDLTRLVAARDWTDHYPSVWVADVAKRALEVIPDEDMKNEQ